METVFPLWHRKKRLHPSLVPLFFLGVLLPSVALSVLALRAASREALYVERRLESALLSEVSAASRRVGDMLAALEAELSGEIGALPSTPQALESWRAERGDVAVTFLLSQGVLFVPGGNPDDRRAFLQAFGPFLRGEGALPVYDRVTDVYRRRMLEFETSSVPASPKGPPDTSSHAALKTPSGTAASLLLAQSVVESAVPEPLLPALEETPSSAGEIPASPKDRGDAYFQAAQEGFQALQRHILPHVRPETPVPEHPRSVLVSRQSTLATLRRQGKSGLLPRLSDGGLDLLLWTSRDDGTVAGALLRRETFRDRLLAVLPEPYTEARVLTVLDDRGIPLRESSPVEIPDWRRPFVAREISPSLPHWEVAAYLPDPEVVTSRARLVTWAVWLLVATLLVAIGVGGTLILRSLSAELRLAGQKTTFVANVSHELKTPLTSIRLFAELLLQKRQPDEKRREEYLHIMVAEAERLSHLVDNVLAFSRQESGSVSRRRAPLDLGVLTAEVGEQLRPHLEREGFDVLVEADSPLPVEGDGEGLRQVLMNLLSNAEKYTGNVRSVELVARPEGREAVVEVRDRGIGVEGRYAERIFHDFFRVDDTLTAPRRGTGLGLSIARGIARDHGGDVTYAPRPGGGSVFALHLPMTLPKEE